MAEGPRLSVVVVASDHNPTILNPDFLQVQGIVPADWGWKLLGPPLTSPPISVVKYDSGVSITVEPNKLQVTDDKNSSVERSKVSEIVSKFVEVLPHVRYTAVGNNFIRIIEMENAATYVKERFFKSGPWDKGLEAANVKFVYQVEDGRCILSVDVLSREVDVAGKREALSAILAGANFHRDCQQIGSPKDQVINFVGRMKADSAKYELMLREIVGIKE